MQTPSGLKYRVRYGFQYHYSRSENYIKKIPKNCLVTIEQPSTNKERFVYFGIARCNLKVDNFKKRDGRELALQRAIDAETNCNSQSSSYCPQGSFYLSKDGTYGYCHVKYVLSLLKHFESLDEK